MTDIINEKWEHPEGTHYVLTEERDLLETPLAAVMMTQEPLAVCERIAQYIVESPTEQAQVPLMAALVLDGIAIGHRAATVEEQA